MNPFTRVFLKVANDGARELGAKPRKATVTLTFKRRDGLKCFLFEYEGFSAQVWSADAHDARARGWELWIAAETANRKA